MEDNKQLQTAWDFVEHTGKSIFLTGKAGTGKTTFLRKIVAESSKRLIVVAPTGVAAINAGGVTIHSFFQLPLSPFIPRHYGVGMGMSGSNGVRQSQRRYEFGKEKRRIIRTLDMLVIDEISMVRSDLLDAVDDTLRRYRDRNKPFGGVQLVMIGDLAQLTPVVTSEEEPMISQYYSTPYFFSSYALQQIDYVTIQLEHIYRQQDIKFVNILNNIRNGNPTEEQLVQLNERHLPGFVPDDNDNYIRLTTHNALADRYNDDMLSSIKKQQYSYHADIEGTFPDYLYPTQDTLTLKVGAQVMFLKNDTSYERRYYNGKIGRVVELSESCIKVVCKDDDSPIEVAKETWENAKYHINQETNEIETDVQGTFCQYPLRLAWAITIHKSQGLTFEHAIIDAAFSFAPGQVYVALSRCRTLEGLVLSTPIERRAVINDERVESYIGMQEKEAEKSIANLPMLRDEYYKFLLCELFDFTDLGMKFEQTMRLVIEYFGRNHPALAHLYKVASEELKRKVTMVSYQWRNVISNSEMNQVTAESFLNRVKNSCVYFCDTLTEIMEVIFKKTKSLDSGNKAAMQRLDNAYAELSQIYGQHIKVLSAMVNQTFSVEDYLHAKQMAWLSVLNEGTTVKTRKLKQSNSRVRRKKE